MQQQNSTCNDSNHICNNNNQTWYSRNHGCGIGNHRLDNIRTGKVVKVNVYNREK